jgi:formylglycine-generating enzyme required for sulfatase activity
MDGNNAEWYVASDGISISGAAKSGAASATATGFALDGASVARQTDNLVKVTPSEASLLPYFLFRKSGATASASIGVNSNAAGTVSSGRGLHSIGGINVIMRNLKNLDDRHEGTTTASGSVAVTDLIAGDTYSVTVPAQSGVASEVVASVTPVFDGQDLGYVTVGDATQNFKVSYAIAGDPDYLYAGQSYSLSIRIKNIGTEDMKQADYHVTQPAGMILSGSLDNILGTVQAAVGEKVVSLSMSVPAFSELEKNLEIPVRVVALDGTEWQDKISLKFYREAMTIYVRSESNDVQGVVISPDRRSTPFVTSSLSGSVTLPSRSLPYILALSGAGYNSETRYAVSTGAAPATNGSELTTTGVNEPNNDETQTTALFKAQTQLGYLGVYDLDFYTVYGLSQADALSFDPPAGTFHANQSVSLSCGSSGTLRYTIDGSDPTSSSPVYSAAIIVDRSTTVKAKVFGGPIPESIVFSSSYILKPDTPQVTVSGSGYAISCATADATIRYTTDGADPTAASAAYSGGAVGDNASGIVKARAWFGAWDMSEVGAPSAAPVPSFVANTSSVNKSSSFDASATTDDDSSSSEIQVRWDFGVGAGWTAWSAIKTASYTYTATGSFTVVLEAKDKFGRTASLSKPISISSYTLSGFDMVSIPAGSFNNGTSIVNLSAFKMSKYDITQSQYQAITGTNPSYFSGNTDAASCPVELVSWFDAVEYCNKLSTAEGLTPVYTISGRSPGTGYPITSATVSATWTNNGYRLPTEAEWEYAARAGSTTAYYWGDASDDATVALYAWFSSNSNNKTHAVGQKLPNAFGLYDMVGNVFQWCWDLYGNYPSSAQTDPKGAVSGTSRVSRGWSYYFPAFYLTLTADNRNYASPGGPLNMHVGFRVVASYPSAAKPTFNPPDGIYATNQSVTISCATPNSTIYYTTDGSDPASSVTRQSGPAPLGPISVTVDPSTTIRAMATASGFTESTSATAAYRQAYSIGDTGPAGGLVFYDKGNYSNNWQYLEVTKSDQSASVQWSDGSGTPTATGATAKVLGTGAANTATIVASQGHKAQIYAASLCDDLVLGGCDDWFLPSKDELNQIFINLKARGLGSFSSAWYWSSSEDDDLDAWLQNLENGSVMNNAKYSNYYVRAVRAF